MTTRRFFLQWIPAAGSALIAARPACAQAIPHLAETEPRALALGYVEDAARADRKKFPKYTPGQTCFGCELYVAPATQAWATCSVFPKRLVAGPGWCDAFRTRRPGR
jgi:hypothetical protein